MTRIGNTSEPTIDFQGIFVSFQGEYLIKFNTKWSTLGSMSTWGKTARPCIFFKGTFFLTEHWTCITEIIFFEIQFLEQVFFQRHFLISDIFFKLKHFLFFVSFHLESFYQLDGCKLVVCIDNHKTYPLSPHHPEPKGWNCTYRVITLHMSHEQ